MRIQTTLLCSVSILLFSLAQFAGAEESRVKPERSITVDRNAWPHFNWASFDQDKIISYGNYQYSIYWDHDGILKVMRRNLNNHTVQAVRLPSYTLSINPKDGHRNTVIGISPGDGRLHLSWDHHNNDLRYTKTRKGFLTDPPRKISKDDFEPKQPLAPEAPQNVTYPRFFNNSQGRLYFLYRSGSSGHGRTVLSRYESEKGEWDVLSTRLFGPDGQYPPWNGSTSRNAYLHDVLFDRNDRLHITWIYREKSRSWASNHDLHYAYSDDEGRTWMNNAGKQVADLRKNDAIVIDDPGLVVREIPVYSWVMNQCAMTLDSRNQPHVVLYKLPETFKPESLQHGPPQRIRDRQRFYHYWRDVEGNWHSSGPLELPEGLSVNRPNIVLDESDTAFIYWASGKGFRCYVSGAENRWRDRELISLTGQKFTSNDVSKHDRRLLQNEGILSFTADPNGRKEGSGYVILDFDLSELRPDEE